MKLKSFQIKNYKSIKDSCTCRLSDFDGITILAGQNEAGKSSVLQGLYSFDTGIISEDCLVESSPQVYPEIIVNFEIENNDLENIDLSYIPDVFLKNLNKLSEISFTRIFTSIEESKIELANESIDKINMFYNENDHKTYLESEPFNINARANEINTYKKLLDVVADDLLINCPSILFFDDFCDILPAKILIKDLTSKNKIKGYQAVKNIESILKTNFVDIDKLTDKKREVQEHIFEQKITADFNEYWSQRIGDETGATIHIRYNQGKAENASYISFYIETKKEEWLTPNQRSQGFKWFLSFYLHLKAESNRSGALVILFDEPGLYLHSKAQSDMINVLEELSKKNQIIYATHSPYLINTNKLHRLRLVLNNKEYGTIIEKITTNRIQNKKEALKPIIDSMGLEIALCFSPINKNNVILEGISDFYYFNAFKKLLNIENDYQFIPSMGASNVHLLMELCMGWNLNWLIIFDEKDSSKDYNKIKKYFFDNDEKFINKFIHRLKGCDGIEDMFTIEDLKLAKSDIYEVANKKNSEIVQNHGGKELIGRLFLEKVNNLEIKVNDLNKATVTRFKEVFDFINLNITNN
jgi:predicted ATP-dependent endonuclease of OLD family